MSGDVLIIENDHFYKDQLVTPIEKAGWKATVIEEIGQAIEHLKSQAFGLVFVRLDLERKACLELIQAAQRLPKAPQVICTTACGAVKDAVTYLKAGAADYLIHPLPEVVVDETLATYSVPTTTSNSFVAIAAKTQKAFDIARRVSASDSTVVITGESGTGKEVLAQFIHQCSPRAHGPFVAINCAAIPENMLEAVLFGYEKGAFTGAVASHAGKFEQAQDGTLLLDEISEISLGLQAKLLRVLQEKECERLCGVKTIPLNVRVLATTNRNLKAEVAAGRFREDLYYRLHVFPVGLAPLRERLDDVMPMVDLFVGKHCHRPQLPTLTASAKHKLREYSWPGNVRELENVVQRALILTDGDEVSAEHIQFEAENNLSQMPVMPALASSDGDLSAHVKNQEHDLILRTLKEEGGSRKKASDKLGISARTLRYKLAQMREAGLSIPDKRKMA